MAFKQKIADIVIPSEEFAWTEGTGGTDMSDLKAAGYNPFHQIFTDGDKTGFAVQSAKTDKTELFLLTDTATNDGDIAYWKFESKQGHTIFVFND